MTLIQRCALTVQLQPSIAHIPGGALSTLPDRNTRHHNNTDHTIARSHFSPFRPLNTLLLPLIFLDPTRRSSKGTKDRVVRRPRSIVFDSLARRSSFTSFTAHRYSNAGHTFIDLDPPTPPRDRSHLSSPPGSSSLLRNFF